MTHQQTYETGIRLWNQWIRMWQTNPELALELVASRFVLHLTPPTPIDEQSITTPEDVERWVKKHRGSFQRLTFHTQAGPFVDVTAGIVAGPWYADASIDGSESWVCGMDTIAFRDGKITEYWTLAKEVKAVGRWGVMVEK
jgi:hypothetical protein